MKIHIKPNYHPKILSETLLNEYFIKATDAIFVPDRYRKNENLTYS